MRSTMNAGGNTARDMARRACGVDLWKTVRLIIIGEYCVD